VLAVIVRYVVLGTALEEVSTILITVPVILPIVAAIGYDGIWFGIFVTAMATIGLISPPVGLTVFVIQAQNPDILAARIYRGTLPFLVADFVLVVLLVAFPGLALWLPACRKSRRKSPSERQSPILFCVAQCTACTRLLTRILRNRL